MHIRSFTFFTRPELLSAPIFFPLAQGVSLCKSRIFFARIRNCSAAVRMNGSKHLPTCRHIAVESGKPRRTAGARRRTWRFDPSGSDGLLLWAGSDGAFLLNDWSFGQVCRLAGVGRETVNRLSPETASRVFAETLPQGTKPVQLFTQGENLRSIHGTSYTRLFDADLVATLQEFAVDFQPPQKGCNGATGLYAGEQDLFCFLIDPAGWTEIEGEAFAPGFFLWNSEVGRRSLGIQTFWFQAVCQNHIVWDAVEVFEFTRKHTANVHESLGDIRRIIEGLVETRDNRAETALPR